MPAPAVLRRAGTLILAGAVLVVLTYLLGVRTGWGQRVDDRAFEGRKALELLPRGAGSTGLVVLTPLVLVGTWLSIAGSALRRGDRRVALAVTATLGGVVVAARLLKEVLPRPELLAFSWSGPANTYPSGHTASMAAALMCLVVAAPAARRSRVATLAIVVLPLYAAVMAAAGWHRPVDLIGGLGLALVAVGAFVLASGPVARVARSSSRREVSMVLVGVLGLTVAVSLVLRTSSRNPDHSFGGFLVVLLVTQLVAVAAVLVSSTLSVAPKVASTRRGDRPR